MNVRRILVNTAVVLATLSGLALLWQLRLAVVLFALSLAIAAAVRPATDFWVRWGIPRAWAILITYLIGLLMLAGAIYFLGSPLLQELRIASDRFVVIYDTTVKTWPEGTPFQQFVASQLPPPEDLYEAFSGERGVRIMNNIIGIAQSVANVLGLFVAVLVLSVYWSADRLHFERLWLSTMPAESRSRMRHTWRSIEEGVGSYLRSEFLQSLLVAVLLGAGFRLIGLEYPTLLGIAAALLRLIPWLGTVLAVILPFSVVADSGLELVSLASLYTLAVLLVLEVAVEPRLFNRRRYSSLLIVLLVVALTDAFSLVGLIAAPVLAVAIQILARQIARYANPAPPRDSLAQFMNLKERVGKLRKSIAKEDSPELDSLLDRLAQLTEQIGDYLGVEEAPLEPADTNREARPAVSKSS